MNEPDPTRAGRNPELPPSLAEELRGAFRAPDDVPNAVEETILGAVDERARTVRASRFRRRFRWLGPIATAAAMVLFFFLVIVPWSRRGAREFGMPPKAPRVATREEIDVLDAFLLARLLHEENEHLLERGWDLDESGTVDHGDVERLLDLAVRLEDA